MIYHCITRVVERRLALGPDEKEQFRTYMRMVENFSGCRVLSYCLMCNHVHLLLEVPPMKAGGLSDEELLGRLRGLYGEAAVAEVAAELADARRKLADGTGKPVLVERIHQRFTYRMHDLGEFMKTLLQRFTRWFNRRHDRVGVLWESRFKSVLVEEGETARTMAAYIDLNPVRAGMVNDPGDYRWSSYGEAMGGGARGNGNKARAGLVRAWMAHQGWDADAAGWSERVSREYRMLLLEEGTENLEEVVGEDGGVEVRVRRKGMDASEAKVEHARLMAGGDVALGKMLKFRVRYFTDGAVLGSRGFVDEVFGRCRERLGPKRMTGARKLKGCAAAAAGRIWSLRDLKKGIFPVASDDGGSE